ncbi:MAG: molybdate ABC transporter substrate-binding protein [Magnetovibrionaceae bacterium]
MAFWIGRNYGCPGFSAGGRALVLALFLALGLCFHGGVFAAQEVQVAVAANFTAPAKKIAEAFQEASGHRIIFSFESTGKLYGRIARGEPFAAFLAANEETPRRAIQDGFAVEGTDFTYAFGRIVLYSAVEGYVDQGEEVLKAGDFNRLVMANPTVAPYGVASMEVLERLNVADKLQPKILRGDTVSKTLQFISSGAADLGFVALSQVVGRKSGSVWEVPTEFYSPIRQGAVLLKAGEGNAAAMAFLDFLKGPESRRIMATFGYGEPD